LDCFEICLACCNFATDLAWLADASGVHARWEWNTMKPTLADWQQSRTG
jgi:hypothetical protein